MCALPGALQALSAYKTYCPAGLREGRHSGSARKARKAHGPNTRGSRLEDAGADKDYPRRLAALGRARGLGQGPLAPLGRGLLGPALLECPPKKAVSL